MHLQAGQNTGLVELAFTVTIAWTSLADMTELDPVALVLGEPGIPRADHDLVFFNNHRHPLGIVEVAPAQLHGQAVLTVDLGRCGPDVTRIVIAVASDADQLRADTPLHLELSTDGATMVTAEVTASGTESAMVLLELYRRGHDWKVRAVGQGYDDGLPRLVTDYGFTVADDAGGPSPVAVTTRAAADSGGHDLHPATGTREFDLNIEKVLDHWTVVHALREMIANALDEAALTNTREPSIHTDADGTWHIRDHGRGLRYEHLTQNESSEKHAHPDKVVGKFGVGLKDALATFDRHDVRITIRSRHGDITTGQHAKHGFDDVRTLHALVAAPSHPDFVGTDVVLSGPALTPATIAEAKDLFLHYSGDPVLGVTPIGTVLRTRGTQARIYVNGLRVATEENFLFSYNVTSSTTKLRQALNRERSNVGRTAYSDRVKAILLACRDDAVIDALVEDLQRFQRGNQHDETGWLDVGAHACQQLNARKDVIFLTAWELMDAPEFLHRAEADGYQVVVIPDSLRNKLPTMRDANGDRLRDLNQYREEWDDSFQFTFIDPTALTADERQIWETLPRILALCGGRPRALRDVQVSETMRLHPGSYSEAVGVYEPAEGRIVIKRTQLATTTEFAGTVAHKLAHVLSDATDESLAFERELTRLLGVLLNGQLKTGD